MSAPIKHAPGVVCLVVGYSVEGFMDVLPGHEAPTLEQARLLYEARKNLVVTIIRAATLSHAPVYATSVHSGPRWEVLLPRPLPVMYRRFYRGGSRMGRIGPTLTLHMSQRNLIPIAGPGIDTSETTGVSSTKPVGSLVTDHIPPTH
jgi:hypothetical protein